MCLQLDGVVVLIVNIKDQISTLCSRRGTDDGWEEEIYREYEEEEVQTRSSDQNQPEASTAPETCWGWGHSEQELTDFVKDAIRINTGPASTPQVTPNTGQDQQTRVDPSNESPPSPSQYSPDTTHQRAHPGPAEDGNLMDDWPELATPAPTPGDFKAEEQPDANSNCQDTTGSQEQVFQNTQSDESQSHPSKSSAELGEQEEEVSAEEAVRVWTEGRSTNICSLLVSLHLVPWPGLHWQPLTMQEGASNQGS